MKGGVFMHAAVFMHACACCRLRVCCTAYVDPSCLTNPSTLLIIELVSSSVVPCVFCPPCFCRRQCQVLCREWRLLCNGNHRGRPSSRSSSSRSSGRVCSCVTTDGQAGEWLQLFDHRCARHCLQTHSVLLSNNSCHACQHSFSSTDPHC